MKRSATLVAAFSVILTVALPFVGGSGPSIFSATRAEAGVVQVPTFATDPATAQALAESGEGVGAGGAVTSARPAAELTADSEHLAQRPLPEIEAAAEQRRNAIEEVGLACPTAAEGTHATAPGRSAAGGVITGTTTSDLATFAERYNAIRVANCLQPVPAANFRYDSCMEDRLIWMAEDPSDDPLSAWGHLGSVRSDGVPSVGCDGNLAGGSGDTGSSVADKWWESSAHRESLYKPDYPGAVAGVCVYFAATHGGVGTTFNEAPNFVRAAARWASC
ncbi:hypothetical protein OH146_05125 [Salinibacterium sp. SYSU T00001]|uniref:hypothetical protein n=1 Tax=Homoserinimonas sedimenticola TaxID=2986805 RepID=UPI002235D322|nr:hypothetical protein [Salinibacterium sedimenticola]MCW4385155.1 hypothetical protein [Salinibacterium sedimenticola]